MIALRRQILSGSVLSTFHLENTDLLNHLLNEGYSPYHLCYNSLKVRGKKDIGEIWNLALIWISRCERVHLCSVTKLISLAPCFYKKSRSLSWWNGTSLLVHEEGHQGTFDSWKTQSANKAKGGTSFCPIRRWWDWLFPHQPVIWNIDAGNKARTMSWVNGHRCFRRGRIHSESYSYEVKVRYTPSESSKIMSFQIGRCLEHLSWDILAKKFRCFRWHRNQGKLLIWIKTWGEKKRLF